MPDEPQLSEPVLAWLEAVDTVWAEGGLTRRQRRNLRSELESSIVEGLWNGATDEDFVSDDPGQVARAIAIAHDLPLGTLRPRRVDRASFRWSSLTGASIGAAAAWLWLLASPLMLPFTSSSSWIVAYLVAGALPLTGAALAVQRRFHNAQHMQRLQLSAACGLLVGGILSAFPCWLVARSLGYPSFSVLVIPEILLALIICAGTADLAWRLARPSNPDAQLTVS